MRLTTLFATLFAAFFTALPAMAQTQTALVAGGCFWCVEADFRRVEGVTDVRVGFAGGSQPNPAYEDVARGRTDHLEVTQITFDAGQISYRQVMDLFLRSIDPFDAGGQFCDRGMQYSTAIFATPEQRPIAQAAIAAAEAELGKSIVTPVRDNAPFYLAEDYHQNYANSEERTLTRFGWIARKDAYKNYRNACGRDAQVRRIWGSDAPFVGG
ncbi:MAG: peptide-methionine (S)-S-oxide reductase MsrA [Rhodobacteraceae bacterium]|nr:peptide-methionine (S)-S-oxide reductase MsrA [Paracoccaceae bacterium]